jgi:WD40 repeat protein
MIRFLCPHCGQKLHTPAEYGGLPSQCPQCGKTGLVPAPSSTVDYVPAMAATLPGTAPGAEMAAVVEPLSQAPEKYPSAPPGYEFEEILGRGGMGVVYKARQIGLNRPVALKMIRDGALAGGQDLARFRGEAEAVARLQHPNIVQIYEIGEHEGRPYFSLEFVAGGSLDKALGGNPLPALDAARLTETLARAIQHAHQHDIIHRDLKPGNILLSGAWRVASGESKDAGSSLTQRHAQLTARDTALAMVLKIGDFGLAKRLGEAAGSGVQTQSNAILGTPSYMAPEQAGGKHRKIGPAVDVYSLGAVLYELLTGRPPFLAATPLDTLMQVAGEEPVPPSRLQPNLPRDLETICLKCLQKDPRKRYETAADLADDLARFQTGVPIRGRPIGRGERLRRWCRRNPVVAGLLAALVLVFAAGFAGVLWKWQEAETAREEATDQALAARAAEETSREEAAKARKARREALDQRRNALQQKVEAFVQREEAQRSLYFNRVALANRYFLANNVERAEELLDLCPPAMRNWEWRYLKRLCRAELLTFRGHRGPVACAAFSPDGTRIASAEFVGFPIPRGIVRIWDAKTGQVLRTLTGHEVHVTWVTFSPDGRRLATSSRDGTVRLWDARTGRPEAVEPLRHTIAAEKATGLGEHRGANRAVFSPDGKRLASCGDGPVKIWNAYTGRELFSLGAKGKGRNEAAFSPDGKQVACAGYDGTVAVWDLATRKRLVTLNGHRGEVASVAYRPDGKVLVSAGKDKTVRIWNLKDGKEVHTLRGHTDFINRVRFSPEGKRIASASDDHTIKVWDATGGWELFTLRGHTGPVHSVAFRRDGNRLVSAGADHTVKVWDGQSGGPGQLLLGGPDLAFSPEGAHVAAVGEGQTVTVWEARTGQTIFSHREADRSVQQVAFSPGGHRLAWLRGGSRQDSRGVAWFRRGNPQDTGVRIADLRTKQIQTLPTGNIVQTMAWSSDGKYFALAEVTGRILLRDADSGKVIASLSGHSGGVPCLAFRADGKRLASCGGDNAIKIWDPATARETRTLWGHTGAVLGVAFNPRGDQLASAGQDGTVKVWDLSTGAGRQEARERLTLKGHSGQVSKVRFSAGGQRLASVSSDPGKSGGEVKVWDARTGQELLTLAQPGFSLAFSPDGLRLASAGPHALIRVWDGSPVREQLCLRGAGQSVAFSADGRRLVSPGNFERVKIWDTRTLENTSTLAGHVELVRHAVFSPDGRWVVSASEDETVKVWDAQTGKLRFTFRGHGDTVTHLAFRPDGKRIASASYDGKVKIWEPLTGKVLVTFAGHTDRVLGVAFSPDGRRVASCGDDRTVRLWDAGTGRQIFCLRGHDDSVNGVAFRRDGRRLASASDDRTIKIWDAGTGKAIRTLRGHTDAVRDVSFGSGGRLASAGWDQTVRVWDAVRGEELLVLRGHAGGVRSVAFAADGRRLASAGEDMTLRVWDTGP